MATTVFIPNLLPVTTAFGTIAGHHQPWPHFAISLVYFCIYINNYPLVTKSCEIWQYCIKSVSVSTDRKHVTRNLEVEERFLMFPVKLMQR